MMRTLGFGFLMLLLYAPALCAQATGDDLPQSSTLTVRSTLVQVPVLVKTKKGELVFTLTAKDFLLTDDGVPQRITVDDDTGTQPLALAIVAQTGGAGVAHLDDYRDLEPILDAIIGDVDHRVALISVDSTPHLVQDFTSNVSSVATNLGNLNEGDQGASILDGLAFAVAQLRTQPSTYRRAILLLSETIDQGSNASLTEALRLISDTNTAVYSFGFSSTRFQVKHEASKLSSDVPGPAHGCFSNDKTDPNHNPEYDGHYSTQVLDCISELAPPLRLATMAFLAARNALRKNTAESIAQLTGGEFFKFHDAKTLQHALINIANDVPNHYVLSFRPTNPSPGLHALTLQIKDRPQLELQTRTEYWIDDDASPAPATH